MVTENGARRQRSGKGKEGQKWKGQRWKEVEEEGDRNGGKWEEEKEKRREERVKHERKCGVEGGKRGMKRTAR